MFDVILFLNEDQWVLVEKLPQKSSKERMLKIQKMFQ